MDHVTRFFMNCKFFEIFLNEHQLTVDDLNQLVKTWINDSIMEYKLRQEEHPTQTRKRTSCMGIFENSRRPPLAF